MCNLTLLFRRLHQCDDSRYPSKINMQHFILFIRDFLVFSFPVKITIRLLLLLILTMNFQQSHFINKPLTITSTSVTPKLLNFDVWTRAKEPFQNPPIPPPLFSHSHLSHVTLLWAYTTDPRSFQVPPRRSIRIILRI